MLNRAILRKEHFGGILYTFEDNGYYLLDELTFKIIKALKNNRKNIYSIDENLSKEEVDEFIEELYQLNIIDYNNINIRIVEKNNQGEVLSVPLKVFISITEYCNLKCSHCFGGYGEKVHMDIKTYKNIIDDLYDEGIFEICLTGGEPFMHPNIVDLLNYAFNKGFKVNISTNGTIVNNEIVEILKQYVKQISRVSVSLDGLENVHNKIRGVNIYNKVINNMKLLEKEGIPISFNCVLNKLNYMQLDNFLDEMIQYGFYSGSFTLVKCVGNARKNGLVFEQKDIDVIKKQINTSIKRFAKLTQRSQFISGHSIDKDGNITIENDSILKHINSKYCGAGIINASIDAHGKVSPCTFINEYFTDTQVTFDSLKDKKFKEVWESGEVFIKMRNLQPVSKCIECKNFKEKLCYGGCPGHIYGMKNTLKEIDPYCTYGEEA